MCASTSFSHAAGSSMRVVGGGDGSRGFLTLCARCFRRMTRFIRRRWCLSAFSLSHRSMAPTQLSWAGIVH